MTEEILRAALEAVEAKTDKDGWADLPEGRTMTLYAAHDGVSLNVAKVESLKITHNLVRARSVKGETFLLALTDVFAAALDGGGRPGHSRKAGFLG
jgi:hypothetical protein